MRDSDRNDDDAQTKSSKREAIRLQRLGFHRVQVAQNGKLACKSTIKSGSSRQSVQTGVCPCEKQCVCTLLADERQNNGRSIPYA